MTYENAVKSARATVIKTGCSVLVYRATHRAVGSPTVEQYGICFTLPMFGAPVERYYPAGTIGIDASLIVEGMAN